MKNQVEALIDSLAAWIPAKQYAFKQAVWQYTALEDWMKECPNDDMFEEACACHADSYLILIGDVLEKMIEAVDRQFTGDERKEKYTYNTLKICQYWVGVGFTASLQEILASTEWEEVCSLCGKTSPCDCGSDKMERQYVPKDKAHREFWEFLLSLNLTK